MSDELKILGTKRDSYSGDFVFATQETAKDKAFSHVSKPWFQKCMTFEQGLEKLAQEQAVIEDIRGPLSDWETVVENDRFGMKHKPTNRVFNPTPHCLKHFAMTGRMSEWALTALTEDVRHQSSVDKDGNKKVVFKRDGRDAELLQHMVNVHLFQADRMDQSKTRLFRTWSNNNTMRAFLSDQYAIVNNAWYLDLLSRLIPGGMLSHWRGDADSIYGNILIPDTIRSENDSDYGGMLSIGNSEIGTREIGSCPSVFRSICMNGCIHNQEVGVEIRKRHRGEIKLDELADLIRVNLQKQIPLLNEGIDRTLAIRKYVVGEVPLLNIFAQIAKDYSISKAQIHGVIKAYGEEAQLLGKEAHSAFGVMGAVTRYGQQLDNEGWLRFDGIGGDIVGMDPADWEGFKVRANNLREKDMVRALGEELVLAT